MRPRLTPRTKTALALGAALALASCSAGTDLARAGAKTAVNSVVTERFPGVPIEPTTDCIIDNATGGEIATLATAAATGDNATATQTVLMIVERPATIRCIAANGVPAILNSL